MDGTVTASVHRRSGRDWFVDTVLFLAAVGFGILMSGLRLGTGQLTVPAWLFNLDQATGAAGCAALWLRRRHPTGLAVTLVALSAYSELVAGAMLVALFSVAVHRPPRVSASVFGLSIVSAACYVVLRPEPGEPAEVLFLLGVALQGAAAGWGLFVHHRRRLVAAQREREERAAAEARLRVEQAQHQAREAIAREMHDVLGHRLSLLSLHAGALEYRPDAPPEEIARAAKIIRESAHQALQDLREVIGVLRAPVGELPQPTFADIPRLIAESVRAGMRVDLADEAAGAVPESVGRTAYRIVQEALTNARKHAPGADVEVRLAGRPGAGLTVEVRNSAPGRAAPPAVPAPEDRPVSGAQGLIGLAERVRIAGGRLEYGSRPRGGWRLAAWLPWPS
jgi:Signal transduction histidine kinase